MHPRCLPLENHAVWWPQQLQQEAPGPARQFGWSRSLVSPQMPLWLPSTPFLLHGSHLMPKTPLLTSGLLPFSLLALQTGQLPF